VTIAQDSLHERRSNDSLHVGLNHKDSLYLAKTHPPWKAAMYSAILPGLGQAYNRKYWKIPILYAGIATDIYFIHTDHQQFKLFQGYLDNRLDSIFTDPYVNIYQNSDLFTIQTYYQKYYNLSVIVAGLIYVINIVDAVVDAHLYYFNVDKTTTATLYPAVIQAGPFPVPAIGIAFNLK
jgi:hypothetical protein